MQPDSSQGNPALPWLIVIAASLAALAFVMLFIIPNCADLPVWGRVSGTCGDKILVAYLCAAVFLGAAVVSGYRLAVLLAGRLRSRDTRFPAEKEGES
jgi:hypothetical protein